MLQVRDGKKIAALGAALRPFPAVAARFDCGDCSFDHAVLIVAFCESPPKGIPDEALPSLYRPTVGGCVGGGGDDDEGAERDRDVGAVVRIG